MPLADGLKVTIGPRRVARSVIERRSSVAPDCVNDGVTIARENRAWKIPFRKHRRQADWQQVATKPDQGRRWHHEATLLGPGPGAGRSAQRGGGCHPVGLRRGMEAAPPRSDGIARLSVEAVAGEAIPPVATVSAGGDEQIRQMVLTPWTR